MTATKLLKRAGLALGLSALTLATTATLSPASAAPTYWAFQNNANGKCLTGSSTTSAVWVSTCTTFQQTQSWDWVGSSTYKQLKNRASGRCLTTDSKSLNNAVWGSTPCQNVDGQLWWFGGNQTGILVSHYSSWLRTSPSGSEAVYATEETSTYADWAEWTGYPVN